MTLTTQVTKNSGWRLFLQTVIGRSYPRVVGLLRERSWMFFDIFLPILAVSAYVFVYRAIGAPEIYIGFVVMGGAMTAFWLNVLWSMSSQLYWEKEMGNLSLTNPVVIHHLTASIRNSLGNLTANYGP